MANPIPCQQCGEIQDCEFLVTDRTPDFQLLGVPTMGLCVQCFVTKGLQLAQALQAAYQEMEAQGEQAGVIEQITQDEGLPVVMEPEQPAPKSRKEKVAPEAGAEVAETASSAAGDA